MSNNTSSSFMSSMFSESTQGGSSTQAFQGSVIAPPQAMDSQGAPQGIFNTPPQAMDLQVASEGIFGAPPQVMDSQEAPQGIFNSPPQVMDSQRAPQGILGAPPQVMNSQGAPQAMDSQGAPQGILGAPPQVMDSQGTSQVMDSQGATQGILGAPQVMDSQGAPPQVMDSGAPQVMDSQGAPQAMDSQRVPQAMDSQGAPQVMDSRAPQVMDSGAPQVMDSGAPQVMDSQGAPQAMDSQGAPQVMDSGAPPPAMYTGGQVIMTGTINRRHNRSMVGVFNMLGSLEPSPSRDEFISICNTTDAQPSNESFMEVVKSFVKSNKLAIFRRFMKISYIRNRYLSKSSVLLQVIREVTLSTCLGWMTVVCQCSSSFLCVNEKLMTLWTRKRFDLVKRCFSLEGWDYNGFPCLSLDTTRAVLRDAAQEDASTEILNSVLVLAISTNFLTCVLQLNNDLSDPALMNLVNYIFLHIDVQQLPQEHRKMLSICSKRDVVFGKILLEAALQGNVCPLPESLQMLASQNKTSFGVLDMEFLAPMFSENLFLRCVGSSMARDTRDVVILLIRSGLLHQFGSWLKTKLEECRRKGCLRCKYCDPSTYLVHRSVPDGPAIQQLLLQSGFLPNRLLFQFLDKVPQPPRPRSRRSFNAGTDLINFLLMRFAEEQNIHDDDEPERNDDNNEDNDEMALRPQDGNGNIIQGRQQRSTQQAQPPVSSSTSSSTSCSCPDTDTESVVKAFIQQPYSLLTMASAQVSIMIGCHCCRTERIRKLPVPKPVQDHVAFRAGNFKLACEKEEEEEKCRKVRKEFDAVTENLDLWPQENYDGDEDVDIDHLYSEDEDDGDDGEEGGGYLRLSAAGEAAAKEMEMAAGEAAAMEMAMSCAKKIRIH